MIPGTEKRLVRPWLEVLEVRTVLATGVSFFSTDTPIAIPDSSVARSTITITDAFAPADVNVTLDVAHPFVSDLTAVLIAPDGTRLTLFSNVGTNGENFRATTLDDNAFESITNANAPFIGRFLPETPLSILAGQNARGTWTLEIADNFFTDSGTLNSWSLTMTGSATLTGTAWDDRNGDGARQADEPPLSGAIVYLDDNGDNQRQGDEPFQRTGPDGSYAFTDLIAKTHFVTLDPPPHYAPTFPQRDLLRTSFDSGTAEGFTTFPDPSLWHLSTGRSLDVGHSAPFSWYFGSQEDAGGGGSYPPNADGFLVSPPVLLPNAEEVYFLEFQHFLQAEFGFDFASVFLFDGNDFIRLASSDPAIGGLPSQTNGFESVRLDVSAFAGKAVVVAFGFQSDSSIELEGWYVDDVVIRGAGRARHVVALRDGETRTGLDFGSRPLADLTTTSITISQPTATWGETVTVEYTVTNQGAADAGPFTVDLRLSPDLGIEEGDLLLERLSLPGLAAGAALTQTRIITLPLLPNPEFADVLTSYVGVVVDTTGDVVESDEANNRNRRVGADKANLTLLTSFDAAAGVAQVPARLRGELARAGERDSFAFAAPATGRITARLANPRLALELYTSTGDLLLRSDTGLLELDVPAGDYRLAVLRRAGGARSAGAYTAELLFQPGQSSQRRQPTGAFPRGLATADVNGDGRLDAIVTNGNSNDVSVLLGTGTGFLPALTFPVGLNPAVVAVADLNRDGRPDLAVANFDSNSVSVLLGNGDGTFLPQTRFAVGLGPRSIALADVNTDGRLDVITANEASDTVSVLLGNGDGTFSLDRPVVTGANPHAVLVLDVDLDGRLDVVTTHFGSSDVRVLYGSGDGTFSAPLSFRTGPDGTFTGPQSLATADVNGDQLPDLLTSNLGTDEVAVMLNVGAGLFRFARSFAAPGFAGPLACTDVNADGLPDVLVAGGNADDVKVLLGLGNGFFQPAVSFLTGDGPESLVVADVDGDGRPDVLTTAVFFNDVSILLNSGDGTFLASRPFAAGDNPTAVDVADVNNDGRLDVIVGNRTSGDVSIFLGNGDGSLLLAQSFAAGNGPRSVVSIDVNRDARPDVLVANSEADTVSVLLGKGDGSFLPPRNYAVGDFPVALACVDVNGDGQPDVVVANQSDNSVSVLLGAPDGTFQLLNNFAVAGGPESLVVTDVNGDGRPDVVTGNYFDGTASVFLGLGDGFFLSAGTFAVGAGPHGVAVADVNGDGLPDVITGNGGSNDVSVLLRQADGTYVSTGPFPAGGAPLSLAVGDVDGDDRPDVLVSTASSSSASVDNVSMLRNLGEGRFADLVKVPVGPFPLAVALRDINADGRVDLVTANSGSGDVSVVLGQGDGTFVLFTEAQAVPPRATPRFADLTGDGVADTVVLDTSGRILFRQGQPGAGNLFLPPVVVNLGAGARDVIVVNTTAGIALAASDEGTDTISLYRWDADSNSFLTDLVFAAGRSPTRLAVGDLNGDGRDDLVAGSAASNSVALLYQLPGGGFAAPLERPVGATPVDLVIADADGRDGADVVVSNRASGDVSILYNDARHSFTSAARFRTGPSVANVEPLLGRLQPRSPEQPVSVVVGEFTGDRLADLVVVNQTARHVSILPGLGSGGFGDADQRFSTNQVSVGGTGPRSAPRINERPGQTVAADFNRDGRLDLAIVMEDQDQVWVYQGLPGGEFSMPAVFAAGNAPTGLSTADANHDGQLDLLVGNGFGDVLILLGNGDGSFRSFVRADARVPFVLTDLDNDGVLEAVVANQARDQVGTFRRTGASQFTPDAFAREGENLIGPGAVAVADLDGTNGTDLIFANTGSNNVLVYLRQPGGAFADQPLSFYAGTSPIALHVADLTGDGRADLAIANQGSNDVSILFNTGGADLFRLGPRLQTGGAGPNAVTSRQVDEDGILDLIVTNGQSGSVSTLFGLGDDQVGTGFFNDAGVQARGVVATAIQQTQIVRPDLGFLLTQGGALVRFDPRTGASARVETGVQVNAFRVAGDGSVFTANADGSVSMLGDGEAGLVTVDSQRVGVGNPGALEVFERAGGLFEVYLTALGESQPVVLTFQLRTDTTQAGETPLALAVVLVSELGGVETTTAVEADAVEVFNPLAVSQLGNLGVIGDKLRAYLSGGNDDVESEEVAAEEGVGAAPAAVERPTLRQFLLGVEEMLKKLEEPERKPEAQAEERKPEAQAEERKPEAQAEDRKPEAQAEEPKPEAQAEERKPEAQAEEVGLACRAGPGVASDKVPSGRRDRPSSACASGLEGPSRLGAVLGYAWAAFGQRRRADSPKRPLARLRVQRLS